MGTILGDLLMVQQIPLVSCCPPAKPGGNKNNEKKRKPSIVGLSLRLE